MDKPGRYSDSQLLQALRSPNPPDWAVRQLYVDCFPMVSSYILGNSGSPQDAEDMFQEAVVTFLEMAADGRFRAESSISSFLYSLIRNRWLNELRRQDRAHRREQDFSAGQPHPPTDPASRLTERELGEQVKQLIGTLGEVCQTILLAFYYEDLPIRDILGKVDFRNEQVLRNKKTKCMKQLVETLTANRQLLQYFKMAFHNER